MSEEKKENQSKDLQVCGFMVGGDYYAVPVVDVQEVIKPMNVTPVPLSADHIRGLINLRGQIVTIVSMRKLFKLEDSFDDNYMSVILRTNDQLLALTVDEVLDVMELPYKEFEDTPSTVDENIKKYIKGVFKLEDKLMILLDVEKVLNI